jgi:hypothetical protein
MKYQLVGTYRARRAGDAALLHGDALALAIRVEHLRISSRVAISCSGGRGRELAEKLRLLCIFSLRENRYTAGIESTCRRPTNATGDKDITNFISSRD